MGEGECDACRVAGISRVFDRSGHHEVDLSRRVIIDREGQGVSADREVAVAVGGVSEEVDAVGAVRRPVLHRGVGPSAACVAYVLSVHEVGGRIVGVTA